MTPEDRAWKRFPCKAGQGTASSLRDKNGKIIMDGLPAIDPNERRREGYVVGFNDAIEMLSQNLPAHCDIEQALALLNAWIKAIPYGFSLEDSIILLKSIFTMPMEGMQEARKKCITELTGEKNIPAKRISAIATAFSRGALWLACQGKYIEIPASILNDGETTMIDAGPLIMAVLEMDPGYNENDTVILQARKARIMKYPNNVEIIDEHPEI